jgi:DNA-3-methyladenine glycosylase II
VTGVGVTRSVARRGPRVDEHRPRSPAHTIGGIALLALPQPYDFTASTERFRAYGTDRANLWHEGGLHRVIEGREVRLEPAPGGVRVEPYDDAIARKVAWLLGAPFDLEGFWAWAGAEPLLTTLREPLAGYRPPLVADPWEMLVTSITAQQVSLHSAFAVRSRLIERFGERHQEAWSFPSRERIAQATESEIREVGFSTRKAEYVTGLARGDLDLDVLEQLPDTDVVETITAQRGLGRWTADWFLSRALGRPDAWPAGDLGVRKAVSFFYGSGRDLDEMEVRDVGERFGPWRNITCHMLLAGARLHG